MKKTDWSKTKTYKVTYAGGILEEGTCVIKAPNKTICRLIITGELNPGIKILKIEEVK